MPLHPKTPSSLASFKIQTDFTFLVLAYPGCPGKEAVKWVYVVVVVVVVAIVVVLVQYTLPALKIWCQLSRK